MKPEIKKLLILNLPYLLLCTCLTRWARLSGFPPAWTQAKRFYILGRASQPPLPALRKKEERKDKLHQAYLRRKASGAQKRYEDKIKARKKAEMDAKKDAIRAEDMGKGVFTRIKDMPKQEPKRAALPTPAAV